ncbi:DUF6544 family protein [Lacimicrobium alkaliphilum]|uniref:Uncharacterized protein n=1 Tax=Lacimicrobium alkaliphilum TaxID=1526571 RepID=A0ABQ1RQT3_9ALTE|nr:DUF6544 family protein [Lacimicrobium alkaliphilum]GGD78704.1 hypothetical protein GCM10011357_37110 [Lacimicrobium alkaliphilum]
MLTIAVLLIILLAMFIWRLTDHRADYNAFQRLIAAQPTRPARFKPQLVADLPEPARRFFLYTIEPDTPLYRVTRVSMSGKFGMGSKAKPDYLNMTATQVFTVPEGFVWKMQARRGWMTLSGSDSNSWTRFWLMGLIPVARLGGDTDHTRSAFGRYVAEAVFWSPASVLPGPGISWELVDKDCARLTVMYQGLSQSVDVTVANNGQPTKVRFMRWSNANADKVHRLQPFGGYLSEFREFGGFHLPTHVEAGNHFETDQYFPFFVADITDIAFPNE